MRFLVLYSLICILLLCVSIFSGEATGKRLRTKIRKSRPCCRQAPGFNLKRNGTRLCRPCRLKTTPQSWVVPGALPLM
ncbi:protein GPR15L [Fukomys damarensis]|uniref:protein GPR15L n=1 Tax=Fukomys damarensis TaxID=885580 RepID=UPI00053F78D4|nr:protein GPR15L [Fukomys damarensis]